MGKKLRIHVLHLEESGKQVDITDKSIISEMSNSQHTCVVTSFSMVDMTLSDQ